MAKPQLKKVLRIGIIQDGKIVQERLIKYGEPVSVGESAKNTFVFPKTHLPKAEYALFSMTPKGYMLNFTEKMRGKISSGGAVVGLDKLRADPSVTKGNGRWRLALTEQDRGKITVDNVTVLFQFVPPPPTQAVRPIHAMDFRPRLLDEDDPMFLGFLAVWTMLAVVLAFWVTTADPPEIRIEEIDDRFVKIILPKEDKAEEEPPEVPEDPDATSREVETKKTEKAKKPKAEKKPETKLEEAQRKAEMEQNVRNKSMMLKMLTTRGEGGRGTAEDLWSDSDGSLGDLDAAIGDVDGVAIAGENSGLREGSGTSSEDVDIGGLSKAGGGTAEVGGGPAVKVEGDVNLGVADYDDVTDQNAVKQVVNRNFGQLKYCYETRLKTNPSLSGRVEVEWNIARTRVTSAAVFANTTGDDVFAQCIVNKIKRWKFPAEVEGEMLYPFLFTPKG